MKTFEDLCLGFCAMEGLPPPCMDAGGDGLRAFSLEVDEVNISVLYDAQAHPNLLFLVAELGVPSAEDEVHNWLSLLEANYWVRSHNAPVFSRNPETGSALFQWALPFEQSTATSLHDTLVTMNCLAHRWRPHTPRQVSNISLDVGLSHLA